MKNFIILFIISLALCSCNDFLDIKSDARYVIPKSLDDAQALLNDMQRMNTAVSPILGESVVDDYYLTESVFNSLNEIQRKFYLWDYQDYFGHGNDWGYAYSAIYNTNLAMELLNKIEKNNENKLLCDNVMGSALFFRSYYFFHLLVNYGVAYDERTSSEDLGIALRLNSNFNEISRRSSVKESLDKIIVDLEESIVLLPDYSIHISRPSKGAAFAALSRVYLYIRDYPKALQYAELALSLNSQLLDFNGDSEINNMNTNSTPFVMFNKEVIFHSEAPSGLVYTNNSGVVDSLLYNSYTDGDHRKTLYYRINNNLPYFRGHLTGNVRTFAGLSTSELYLTKAECLAFLNEPNKAFEVLNTLLFKRIANFQRFNYSEMSSNEVLEVIRKERRKELAFRNIRFMDIKRYNKEGANIVIKRKIGNEQYILEPNSRKYALPLPKDLIQFTGMEQN